MILATFSYVTLVAISLAASFVTKAFETNQYELPEFDLASLRTDAQIAEKVLKQVEKEGFFGISNIPRYSDARNNYLTVASNCAWNNHESGKAEFLLHKTLKDTTRRFTISTQASGDIKERATDVDAFCPGYKVAYDTWSALVNDVIGDLGKSLGLTNVTVTKENTNVPIYDQLMNSLHLDHFHAYQAPSLPRASAGMTMKGDELSLEMHLDNGVMIAMSTPKYFNVPKSGDGLKEASVKKANADAGLIVELSNGTIVAPILKPDVLVIMIGSGFKNWLKTNRQPRPVPHGMKYPTHEGEVRAWSGKMVLLEERDVMKDSGMTFGDFGTISSRFLLAEEVDSHFAALACPSGRRLQASDKKCTFQQCKQNDPSAKLKTSCVVSCNRNHKGDKEACEADCKCSTLTKPATVCWMLCVLDPDDCSDGQKCVDQTRVCANNSTASSTSSSSSVKEPVVALSPAPVPVPKSFASSIRSGSVSFFAIILMLIMN